MPLLVFLIFVVGGPPLGLMVFLLETFVSAWTALAPNAVPSGTWQTPRPADIGMLLVVSYVFGGAPATLTGLVATLSFGLSDYTRVSLKAVLITAALADLPFLLLLRGPVPLGAAIGLMVVHLGAAFGCWLMTAGLIRIAGRPPDPAPNHDAYFARPRD